MRSQIFAQRLSITNDEYRDYALPHKCLFITFRMNLSVAVWQTGENVALVTTIKVHIVCLTYCSLIVSGIGYHFSSDRFIVFISSFNSITLHYEDNYLRHPVPLLFLWIAVTLTVLFFYSGRNTPKVWLPITFRQVSVTGRSTVSSGTSRWSISAGNGTFKLATNFG